MDILRGVIYLGSYFSMYFGFVYPWILNEIELLITKTGKMPKT